MSNILYHKDENDGDGSSSGIRKYGNAVQDVSIKNNGCNYGGHRQKSVPDWVALSKGQTMLVSYRYGKVQMNIAQMFRVPWSKVTEYWG